MTLFLILAPFATFAALMMTSTIAASLAASALVAAAVLTWEQFNGRSLKVITLGALAAFSIILAYHTLASPVSATTTRLAVDGALAAIALVSLAIRRPFTLQYAREMVDAETQMRPRFMETNYILTGVWTAAFALMFAADALTLYVADLPIWIIVGIAFVARNTATLFTQWYPKRVVAYEAAQTAAKGV
ncbi:MAG: hypothetical protein HY242_06090 [Afipia sp.]|nr:hypothetical protein [Afipia sp.]